MVEKQLKALTPPKLRIILIAMMALLLVAGGVIFWYLRSQLVSFAHEVHEADIAAEESNANITQLQNLQRVLEENEVAINRADRLVLDSSLATYQDTLINEITTFAEKSGLKVSSFSFNPSGDSSANVAGIKTTTVTVTLSDSASYREIMEFMHYIEYSLIRMRTDGLAMTSGSSGSDKSELNISSISLEVFIK
jgi:Tfp pilus assembly protein PilO